MAQHLLREKWPFNVDLLYPALQTVLAQPLTMQ